MSKVTYSYSLSDLVQTTNPYARIKDSTINIPFPYIKYTDITVTINGEVSTEYDWINGSSIVVNKEFDINNELPITVVIERKTELNMAEFQMGSALRAEDFNENYNKLVLAIEELRNA